MSAPGVNELLEPAAGGGPERVLWIDPSNRGLYSISIEAAGALPVFRTMEEVEAMLVVASDPWLRPLPSNAIPPSHQARRDQNWALIQPLVCDRPAIFLAKSRGRAIADLIARRGSNKHTLYRLLRRYWQRGQTLNALLPDYAGCGGRGKDRGPRGDDAIPELQSMIRAVISRSYAKNQKMTLRDAYGKLLGTYFSDRKEGG